MLSSLYKKTEGYLLPQTIPGLPPTKQKHTGLPPKRKRKLTESPQRGDYLEQLNNGYITIPCTRADEHCNCNCKPTPNASMCGNFACYNQSVTPSFCGNSCPSFHYCTNQETRFQPLPLLINSTQTGIGHEATTPYYIDKDTNVIPYLGEVFCNLEDCQRSRPDHGYIAKLGNYFIDAKYHGSPARFLNHSCEPNCALTPILTPQNKLILMVRTIRDIAPYERLTFNYHWSENATPCLCAAPSCHGFIEPAPRKRKRSPPTKVSKLSLTDPDGQKRHKSFQARSPSPLLKPSEDKQAPSSSPPPPPGARSKPSPSAGIPSPVPIRKRGPRSSNQGPRSPAPNARYCSPYAHYPNHSAPIHHQPPACCSYYAYPPGPAFSTLPQTQALYPSNPHLLAYHPSRSPT